MANKPGHERSREGTTTLYLRGVPLRLAREAKALAARRGISLTALVIEGLARDTGLSARPGGELPNELRADAAWYDEHKEELLEQYRGRYLAILDRQVLDHDEDFGALARRVFSRTGPRPLFMPRCMPEERVVEAPSPRAARG